MDGFELTGDRYTYDPTSRLWNYTTPSGEQPYAVRIEDLTNNLYTMRGNVISANASFGTYRTGQFIRTLPTTREVVGIKTASGPFVVLSTENQGTIARTRPMSAGLFASAELTITDQSGLEHTITTSITALTKQGQARIVKEQAGEIVQWSDVPNRLDPVTGRLVDPPAGWRFATPDEMVLHAIAGEIAKKHETELADLINGGVIDGSLYSKGDRYKVAEDVVRLADIQVTLAMGSVFGA